MKHSDGNLRLKSRIVVHDTLYAENHDVRADCVAADILLVRLFLCLGAFLGLILGVRT